MNINRNNYEEFFVLYADNELSVAEKQLVESFVNENPDLQQEFSLLQQSKLISNNDIVFENKELLMRSGHDNNSVINHSNYEEFFLLYVDNELNEENKKAVEEFATWHPSFQLELIMLQKARLAPDSSIVFEGKEKLYKEESRKVFLFSWQRIAAAAVVLLITGLFVFKYKSKNSGHSEVAVENKINNQSKNSGIAKKDQTPVTSIAPDSLNNTKNATKEMALQQKKQAKKLQADIKVDEKNKLVRNKKNTEMKDPHPEKGPIKQETDISPVVVKGEKNNQDNQINTDNIALKADATATITNLKTNDAVKDPAAEQTNTSLLSKQVAIAEQDGGRENPNSFLAFSTKKNKMRGIFRKVSRVFEKTTNVDSDKPSVLIGNFQIALK